MNGVPPEPGCQSAWVRHNTSPRRMPVSASAAKSRRSRSDPDHSPLKASRAAHADKIPATCPGVSSGQASRRLGRTGTGLRRPERDRLSRWARNAR
jgi:hypothetical protein